MRAIGGPASTEFELGPSPFVHFSGLEVPDGGAVRFTTGDGGFGSTSTQIVGVGPLGSLGPACVLVCCPLTDGCDSSSNGYASFLSECP